MTNSQNQKLLILEFKKIFDCEVKANQVKYYESDARRIAEDDIYCQRFLDFQEWNVEKAFKMAKVALTWRKDFGVLDITDNDIDKEIVDCSVPYLIPFGNDRKDNNNVVLVVKNTPKNDDQTNKASMKYMVYLFEMLDKKGSAKGISYVVDCEGAGLGSVNMTLTKFMVDCITTYYPSYIKSIQVLDMPMIFTALWALIKSWLPKPFVKNVLFLNKDTLKEHTEPCYLPINMGGTAILQFDFKTWVARNKKT